MKELFNNIIDYNLIENYSFEKLKQSLILPIRLDGVYLNIFSCNDSQVENLDTKYLIKNFYLKKEFILFFLDDIENRIRLYNLSILCIKKSEINSKYIEEFINKILFKAITLRSSDIHIESLENSIVIRYRIDGILKLFYIFKKSFITVISSYLKMISNLDITQNRLPLDSSFSYYIEKVKYDFRISTMPTIYGESIVLRVLHSNKVKKDLKTLGFSSDMFSKVEKILRLNQGLVLISGPTGSGKSTTLYSIIQMLNTQHKKIITIEDPVEYKIPQVQQVNIQDEIGLSFDKVLKNILRQDPDIILIGEIRDSYSLQIALQASLTGHIVFASIHANNSIETVFRLIDLKADKYLLSSTLKYIISQRLILNLCKYCKGKGCSRCNFTFYSGRSCIAEVLNIDNNISSMILKGSALNEINEYLKQINFKTMLDDGILKVEENITTLDEVYKVL